MNLQDVLVQLRKDARLVGEPSIGMQMEQEKWAAAGRLTTCSRPMIEILLGGGSGSEGDLIAAYERAIQQWPVTDTSKGDDVAGS